jgi:hypothetical protein
LHRYCRSNILKPVKFQSTNFKIGDPDPISMIQTNDFINPGDEVRDKMKSIEKSLVNNGLKEIHRI